MSVGSDDTQEGTTTDASFGLPDASVSVHFWSRSDSHWSTSTGRGQNNLSAKAFSYRGLFRHHYFIQRPQDLSHTSHELG